ncbi:hypothetical protein DYB25_001996, partial [Aphanomyces astaci]
ALRLTVCVQIPELFDTFFVVIRKKPLRFLHWYHHITVLLFCWHAYSVRSSSVIYLSTSSSSSTTTCHANRTNLQYGIVMYASYFALFLHFFIQRYSTTTTSKKSQ